MKASMILCLMLAGMARANDSSAPIGKVIEMISELEQKVIAEGKDTQKVYEEAAEFCEDRSKELSFEIKTQKEEITSLKAVISEETAAAAAFTTKIEELSGALATSEADLKAATEIREKEAKDFSKVEADLTSVIDTLGRAIGILEKELAKGGASMVQIKSAKNMAQALSALVDASVLTTSDESKLTALIQNAQKDQDSDADTGAPDPAVYKGQSGNIVEVMQGLFEKAEAQLADARKTEEADMHNFAMLKQSLEDQMKYGKKEMAEAQTNLAGAEEKKSTAEGDLTVTSKDLAEDVKVLDELHADCTTKSTDFEDETNTRAEELKALAEAKKIIKEATSLAQEPTSFLQEMKSSISSRAQLANFEAVQFVRQLAKKEKSAELAQLASRMSSAMQLAATSGADPFAKVKSLIKDMIEKLEGEAEADSSKKAYCDKENGESEEKKAAKEAEVEKLSTSIDSMTARSAKLKEEISTLAGELGALAKAQATMDTVRMQEKEVYDKNRAEMEKGIAGIKAALKTLSDFYASGKGSQGAGSSIISLLEVCESDFTKGLAEMNATEESAVAEYDKQTKENEISKTTKEQDVKYKTKEAKGLDKSIAETSQDLSGVKDELDAVLEYLARLKGKCFPIPAETYEETVERRAKEVEGLKQALKILEGEAVLLQRESKKAMFLAPVHRVA